METAPPAPSRSELEARLNELISGELARDEATAWAMRWVAAPDAGVDDPVVWRALNNLAGADAPSIDRDFLFGEDDFRSWLDELRQT